MTSPETTPTDLVVYSPVDTAVHQMHLDAISSYARAEGVAARSFAGRPTWAELRGPRDGRTVIVEASGLWNLVVVPALRRRGDNIVYYLHEPSTLRTKISRGNGLIKSIAWQLVQRLDVALSTTVIVSRDELRERTRSVYGVRESKIEIAPLLIPPPLNDSTAAPQRRRITYLGRIDERRYLLEFLGLADDLHAAGWQPTILTADKDAVADLNIPSTVDVIAERNFSEDTKAEILRDTAVVWNPKKYKIAQSGVTVDALRYGCQIVLTDGDPECRDLEGHGIAIRFDGESMIDLTALEGPGEATAAAASELFTQRHGEAAFQSHYMPLLSERR